MVVTYKMSKNGFLVIGANIPILPNVKYTTSLVKFSFVKPFRLFHFLQYFFLDIIKYDIILYSTSFTQNHLIWN